MKFFPPLLFVAGFLVFLSLAAQTAQAAQANLTISPTSGSYTVGQTFNVQVVLSVDQQNTVDGIDIHYLDFTNPGTVLEVVSQTPGTLCSDTLTNTFNNTAGWVDLSQVSGGGDYCSSSGTVLTINFRAKAAGSSVLSFDAQPGNSTDTNVASGGQDILVSTSGATFTINPTDTTPPVRSNGAPSGILATGTTQTTISLITDENAICKYSTTAGTTYGSMTNTFTTTGVQTHSNLITGLNGQSYNYYVRCQDTATPPNVNTTDFTISFSVAQESTPPTGCLIKINNDVAATNSLNVSLNISGCQDPSGMGQVKFSNTGVDGWSTEENYNTSDPKSWALSNGDSANKTVYAQFSDAVGNWTGNITDAILLDTTAPAGLILINGTNLATKNTAVVLSLGASDTLSPPVSQMRFSNNNTDWTSAPVAYALSISYNLPAGDGAKNVYVKFKDSLENWSAAFFDDIILDQTAPLITVSPFVSEITQTSAKINWTTNEASTSQVEYGLDISYGTSTNIDTNLVFSHAVSLSGLTVNQTYHYRVKSKDSLDNEKISEDYTFITSAGPDTAAPAAIVLQVANDLNNPENAIILTWTAPADDGNNPVSGSAANYDIRYSTVEITADNFATANIAPGIPTPNTPGTVETFTVIGLSRQTKYYFAAKAADEGPRWSTLSNVPSIETSDKTAPAKIDNLAVDTLNTTNSKIKLTWSAPGDDGANGTATSYDIRYSIANIVSDADFNSAIQVEGETAPKIAGSTEAIEVQNLSANTTYYFAIKTADDKGNWSILSNIVSEKIKETPPSSDTIPPAQITDLSSSSQSVDSVTLTWAASGDDGVTGQATSYNIRYSTSDITDANFTQATAAPGLSTFNPKAANLKETFTVIGLSVSTKYYFAIRTSDEVPNVSVLSNIVQATTLSSGGDGGGGGGGGGGGEGNPPSDITPPAKPTEFKAEISATQVSLSWKNPKDADFVRVKILRKEDKYPTNSTDGLAVYEGNKESFVDKDLALDKIYYYSIFACDGVPNWSQAVNLKADTSPTPISTGSDKGDQPAKVNLVNQSFAQPVVLKLEPQIKDKKFQVILSWQNPDKPEVKKINIWRSEKLCQRGELIKSLDLPADSAPTQYTDVIPEDKDFLYILSSANSLGQESHKVQQWSSKKNKIVGYLTRHASSDKDCDGLADAREEKLYKTDPNNSDTDKDGFIDGFETESGFNPVKVGRSGLWDTALAKKLKGKIIFAPNFYGEAYYMHPENLKAYYLNRPHDAFEIMRAFGLGITNVNLDKIPQNTETKQGDLKLRQRLSGKILLQVEDKGKAWYIYPNDLKRYSLGRPTNAFEMMRSLSLGVSNENLIKLDLQL